MPLLKSLICLKGYDNGRRFLIISLLCYFLLVILAPILNRAVILLMLLLLVASPILLASSMRRIHDAGFATPLAGIPILVFWLNLFGLAYIEHGAKWVLLFFGLLVSIAMGTISNAKVKRNHKYAMGYSGPINLSEPQAGSPAKNRIEPTITSSLAHKDNIAATDATAVSSGDNSQDFYAERSNDPTEPLERNIKNHANGWEQRLEHWFITNKKQRLIALGLLGAYIIAEVLFAIFSSPSQMVELNKVAEPTQATRQRLNKIEMPDSFWVMHDQNDSITIAWEGDFKSESDLEKKLIYWSAATAKGDKECANLHFSLGENIKSLLVTVKNGGDYYADFSPIDSELIIKSIADKDRFKLCGYEFTLKGTRSLLRDNPRYREYLMTD